MVDLLNPKQVQAAGCVITVFSKQYDVAPLQGTHSGGNIFVCGSDMTASYQGKHGTDVARMQPYLVVGSTPTLTLIATPTPIQTGPTSSLDYHYCLNLDDDEDEEIEDVRVKVKIKYDNKARALGRDDD